MYVAVRRRGDESAAQYEEETLIGRPWCRRHHGTRDETSAVFVAAVVVLARENGGRRFVWNRGEDDAVQHCLWAGGYNTLKIRWSVSREKMMETRYVMLHEMRQHPTSPKKGRKDSEQ